MKNEQTRPNGTQSKINHIDANAVANGCCPIIKVNDDYYNLMIQQMTIMLKWKRKEH